jgi:hypothetical protein
MPARRLGALRLASLLLLSQLAPAASAQPTDPGFPLSRITLVEQIVEQRTGSGAWRPSQEGRPLLTGESLRTAPAAVARIELGWMALTLSPGSEISFPDAPVLSALLERGRVRVHSDQREMLKLLTPEAEVRGQGQAVVRRENGVTMVVCLDGRFRVEGAGRSVLLERAEAATVRRAEAPSGPLAAPAPPRGLQPGSDPSFVARDESIALAWEPGPGSVGYHVELTAVGSDEVLIARDVESPPWRVTIPWLGAFRWRVSTRDARGLEGVPSEDGLVCVDEM